MHWKEDILNDFATWAVRLLATIGLTSMRNATIDTGRDPYGPIASSFKLLREPTIWLRILLFQAACNSVR